MRTLGLIGGMSWESTAVYYRLLNENVRARLGGLSSAQLLLYSVDFAPIAKLQAEDDWPALTSTMVDAARRLEGAGADAIMICANTMHRMADDVEAAISVPLIHIADATAEAIKRSGTKRPLLLATRFAMEQEFYTLRLSSRHGIAVIIPHAGERAILHSLIFDELCRGIVKPDSKARFLAIVERARKEDGIDGVILGCTEFGMLAGQDDLDIPVFDTALIHSNAGVDFALGSAGAVDE